MLMDGHTSLPGEEQSNLSSTFLNLNISLNIIPTTLKYSLVILHVDWEGMYLRLLIWGLVFVLSFIENLVIQKTKK